ncbi:MAG: IPExxxVDY family protein [Bacteroidia bacterium]|nr:IPExxxVDY family protein [Bacteroidia bacterium]
MRRKKHKLIYTPEYNFAVIGIASHESDYRLSWAINEKLNFNFVRDENIKISEKNFSATFSIFSYEDKSICVEYNLISNRCENDFLIEEYRNIDYLILIHGNVPSGFTKEFISALKHFEIIIHAFEIDIKQIKTRQRLLF